MRNAPLKANQTLSGQASLRSKTRGTGHEHQEGIRLKRTVMEVLVQIKLMTINQSLPYYWLRNVLLNINS